MAAPQSASQLELSIEEFLAGRLALLAIEDVGASLRQQAGKLRMALTLFNIACGTTAIFAFIALLLTTISFADILSGHFNSGILAGDGALMVLWLALLIVCIRGTEVIRHRSWLTKGRRFDISGSDLFATLFEPLLDGTVTVATLSDSGTGIAVTPNSKRPIARYLTRRAFADRALPALLLRNSKNHEGRRCGLLKAQTEFVILSPINFSDKNTPDCDSAAGIVNTVGNTKKSKGSKSAREDHWLSTIGELDYLRLSKQVADRYTGTQQRQVQTMLDTAYGEFNRQSDLPVSDVASIVCDVLRSTKLPIGLDKPEADEWINRMLARSGDKHPYSFVRRFMTEPGYLLPNGRRDEPELDLSPR